MPRLLPILVLTTLLASVNTTGAATGPGENCFLQNIHWVDTQSGRLLTDRSVEISNGMITAIGTADADCPATGYLMPSLWDAHTHVMLPGTDLEQTLGLLLCHGITGIRDMGGSLEVLQQMRELIQERPGLHVDLLAAGAFVDGDPPVSNEFTLPVSDIVSLQTAIDQLVAQQVSFIKVYTLFPAELFDQLMELAAQHGLRVAGHLPYRVSLKHAAESGMESIEHLVDERGHFCDMSDDGKCQQAVMETAATGIIHTPVISVIAWKSIRDQDPYRLQRAQGLLRILADLDTPLLAGSDTGVHPLGTGESLLTEIKALSEAGLSNREVLQAATVTPRIAWQQLQAESGWIGSEADLVLYARNPLEDLSTLQQPLMTYTNGVPASGMDGCNVLSADSGPVNGQ